MEVFACLGLETSSIGESDSLCPSRGRKRHSGSRLLEARSRLRLRGDSVQFIALEFRVTFINAQRQHLPTLNINGACLYHDKNILISKKTIDYFGRQRTRSRHTSDLRKNKNARCKAPRVNTYTERRIEKTFSTRCNWSRDTYERNVNGLCPAGRLNEQSITMHWFQSIRTCPYIVGPLAATEA